jgi:hypothetical protein
MSGKTSFSPRCTVCLSDDSATINLAIARGVPVATIHNKWPSLSSASLFRHKANHLPDEILARLKVRSLAHIVGKNISPQEILNDENQSYLATIVAMKAKLLGAIQAAEVAGQGSLVSSLSGRLLDWMSLEGKILGQVSSGGTSIAVNYIASDSFIRVRSAIFQALRKHPAAMADVAAALQALPPETGDVVDVEATIVNGTGEAPAISSRELVQATTTDRPATLPDVARPVPPIIRTEQYDDGQTRKLRLSR